MRAPPKSRTHVVVVYVLYLPASKHYFQVTWVRKGAVQFHTVGIAGYVGQIAAVRPKGYAVSLNGRHRLLTGGLFGIIQWLAGMTGEAKFPTILMRELMTNATTFEDAKQVLGMIVG